MKIIIMHRTCIYADKMNQSKEKRHSFNSFIIKFNEGQHVESTSGEYYSIIKK